jgi:hypothetical protein
VTIAGIKARVLVDRRCASFFEFVGINSTALINCACRSSCDWRRTARDGPCDSLRRVCDGRSDRLDCGRLCGADSLRLCVCDLGNGCIIVNEDSVAYFISAEKLTQVRRAIGAHRAALLRAFLGIG